ncbi:MAG: insulinase family protein [Desulfobacterales bacterium]|nr:insulinase family protein [Desulfobacterales bacterium]MDX2513355.1 insulinase family protein [Desulfobacterales bacterium]
MCKKIKWFFILLIVFFSPFLPHGSGTIISGLPEAMAVSSSVWPHEKTDLPLDSEIVCGRLDNGFRYVLMQNQNPKDRVSMHLNIQAGSANETASQQGLAHFLEHMLFNGSEHFKPGELVKYFQSIGMQFGADANAHTGFYETVYDIFLPDGHEESFRKGLLVMQDYAKGALLLDSEIERERKVILAEKRQRDSASYRTFVSGLMFELPDARITQRLPIGKEEIIQQATQADLKAYYDTWYRPETMILVAVGAFDLDMASTLISEYFASFTPRTGDIPEIEFGDVQHKGVQGFYHHEAEAGNTTVTIEVLNKVPLRQDNLSFRRERIKKRIADQIVQNRVDAHIGTPEAPGTSAGIGSGLFVKQIAYAMISADGAPGEWKSLLGYLEQTLRQALAYGFTASELERVKKDIISNLEQADSQKGTRDSKALARRIMGALNSDRVLLSPRDAKDLMVPFVTSLTVDDVNRAFKKTWAQHHRLIQVTGNADFSQEGLEPATVILQSYQESIQKSISPWTDKQDIQFPYLPEPVGMGRIIKKKIHDDLDIIQIDYENGFRLNLKKTNFKDDEILASLSFGKGRFSEPPELAGLAELSIAVVNESGLGSLDRSTLEAALAGKQSQVVFGIDEAMFVFNGESIPEELPLLFQLLYAHIEDPGYREEAFDLVMSQFKNQYEEISHTLDGVVSLQGKRFLAGGDSRFGLPPHDDFKKLRLNDIRNWIGKALSGSDFELSLVGDFDVDHVIKLASQYFGMLPSAKNNPPDRTGGPVFPSGEHLRVTVDTKIPNGLVYVSYATDDIWDIHRTRRLYVLADVFSERMRIQIREKLGEAYSPFAYNMASRIHDGYGVFNAVVEVIPARAQLVVDEIQKIARDLSQGTISPDEIKRSLGPTLNSIKDMRQRNGYWLKTVLVGSKRNPEKIEWSRSIVSDYAAITSGDLKTLSKRYLINENAAFIEALPTVVD